MTSIPEDVREDVRSKKSVADAFVLFFVSLLLLSTVGALAFEGSMTVGLFLSEILLILVPALVYVRLKHVPTLKALRLRAVGVGVVLRSAILGCLELPMFLVIYLLTVRSVEAILGPDPSADFTENLNFAVNDMAE